MKKILLLGCLTVLGCTFPVQLIPESAAASQTPTQAPIATVTPSITPEPGTEKNPLILALAPSPRADEETVGAGEVISSFLESRTGYRVVTVVPPTESTLVESFGTHNAHIASFSPFAYLQVRRNGWATALLASQREGQMFYGVQFIANRDQGLVAYYDPVREENTAEAAEALKQLDGRKPCWSDDTSPSGYVVPLGLLNLLEVRTRRGAFLGGQPSVVRAVYAQDICDFGVTFIDARRSPALEHDYPDVIDRVTVIWRMPRVIPYENISISTSLPLEMHRVLQRAFIDLMLTPEGKSAMQTVYGMDGLQIVENEMYDEFERYVEASQLELIQLYEGPKP